jgi:circadian clock protein KaiC
MMRKIQTHVAGLDQILGGIPEFASVLISGAPGSGKTILAQNILFNISASGDNVLYLSTSTEPQVKVLRYQQQYAFFNSDLFLKKVLYQDIGGIIRQSGYRQALQKIEELVREHYPVLVVLDSLKALADYLLSPNDFREFVLELNLNLSIWGCTVLLLGEYREEELISRPEAAIVDGIIYLSGTEERKHQKRFLRVLKMRGTGFMPGEHAMFISDEGIKIYPRLRPEVDKQNYALDGTRQPTGISGLDQMMAGGISEGTCTLVSGATGTGKTLLGLSWLCQGCRSNEPGLLVTFDESPAQLIRSAASFGWALEPYINRELLQIYHSSPVEFDADELVYKMIEKMNGKIKRVVIDSISTFELGMPDKVKYTDYLWGLTDYFKANGISLMMINESQGLFEMPRVSKEGISYMADNIVIFQYQRQGLELHRQVGILKMRGSGHCHSMCTFSVGEKGPEVLNAPAGSGT